MCENKTWRSLVAGVELGFPNEVYLADDRAPQGRKSLAQHAAVGGVLGKVEKDSSPFRDGTNLFAGIGVLRLLAALVAQDDTANS